MKKILHLAGVSVVSGIIFYISYLSSMVQGVADGSEVSYYFVQKGFPFAFYTSIEGKGVLDWKMALVDYLLILAAVLLVYFAGKFMIKKWKGNFGSVVLWILGIFFALGGVYLLPATMWRSISITMLSAGIIMIIVGVILLFINIIKGKNSITAESVELNK